MGGESSHTLSASTIQLPDQYIQASETDYELSQIQQRSDQGTRPTVNMAFDGRGDVALRVFEFFITKVMNVESCTQDLLPSYPQLKH